MIRVYIELNPWRERVETAPTADDAAAITARARRSGALRIALVHPDGAVMLEYDRAAAEMVEDAAIDNREAERAIKLAKADALRAKAERAIAFLRDNPDYDPEAK